MNSNLLTQFNKTVPTLASYFVTALGDSTDTSDGWIIYIYRRCERQFWRHHSMGTMKNALTGEDLYESLSPTLWRHRLSWYKLISGGTTNSSPNLAGMNRGFLKSIQDSIRHENRNWEILVFCCIIHREELCKTVLNMNRVRSITVNLVNVIRVKGLVHRQITSPLQDLDAGHSEVTYHSNNRYFSREVLKRVWDSQEEMLKFLDTNININFSYKWKTKTQNLSGISG
jgi:hypothetical protein